MPSSKKANKPHLTTRDVFDDLGLSVQETFEAKVKYEIWRDLIDCIERRGIQPGVARTKAEGAPA
jgi:hypothetical protein